jgi:hypothetical protein
VTEWDGGPPAELAGAPLGAVPIGLWPGEGNVVIGVVCGVTLSAPIWLVVIGAAVAVLG